MNVEPGAIHYFEIITDDVAGTCRSYEAVYGWRFEPEDPVLGGARVAQLPDGSLCGVRAPMHDQEEPIVRNYVRVDDVEQAVAAARDTGAFVALEPTELPGHGTIAIYFIGGIEQGVWELPAAER